ncbi:hypothetical protein [Thalassoglobus sp.]|uniref:hypothetical protein n=1 Tax=Thalassoglobus sp. TaxID=2795869 RepID=UPI003AA8DDA0
MKNIRCLLTEDEIAEAVARLGEQLTQEYSDSELTILGVLTGSIVLEHLSFSFSVDLR